MTSTRGTRLIRWPSVVPAAVRSKIGRRQSWAALASHPPRRKSIDRRVPPPRSIGSACVRLKGHSTERDAGEQSGRCPTRIDFAQRRLSVVRAHVAIKRQLQIRSRPCLAAGGSVWANCWLRCARDATRKSRGLNRKAQSGDIKEQLSTVAASNAARTAIFPQTLTPAHHIFDPIEFRLGARHRFCPQDGRRQQSVRGATRRALQ
jgi:hypothetical protein